MSNTLANRIIDDKGVAIEHEAMTTFRYAHPHIIGGSKSHIRIE
jgi:hypothetical protein